MPQNTAINRNINRNQKNTPSAMAAALFTGGSVPVASVYSISLLVDGLAAASNRANKMITNNVGSQATS